MNTFSERLRFYRKEANLTQKDISIRTGISEPTIRKYEAGKLNPKIETVKKFAIVLNVSISDLIDLDLDYNKPVKPIVNKNVSKIMGCLYFDCGNCGNQLRSFAKFCDQCGKPVGKRMED